MAIPVATVVRKVVNETGIIDLDRASQNKPIDYFHDEDGLKNAMFYMHCAWQELYFAWQAMQQAVRAKKDLPERAVLPAIKLAAAAIKLAADLGTPSQTQHIDEDQAQRKTSLEAQARQALSSKPEPVTV